MRKYSSAFSIAISVWSQSYNDLLHLNTANADLFICGHSHILKVMYDEKHKLLHMNPGAIGDYGIHKVKTILSFNIERKEIKDLKVIEFPRSKS